MVLCEACAQIVVCTKRLTYIRMFDTSSSCTYHFNPPTVLSSLPSCANKTFPVSVNAKNTWHTYTYKHKINSSENASTTEHTPTHWGTLANTPTLSYVCWPWPTSGHVLASIPQHTPNHISHPKDTQTHTRLSPQNPISSNISNTII